MSKMSPYQQFIHMTRYSRWLPEQKRRETWTETVQRYIDFFVEERGTDPRAAAVLKDEMFTAIKDMKVMPSMRALMTAGEALRRSNTAGFNCSYIAVNSPASFSEALYILMCGTGVGFSCERQEIVNLPIVPAKFTPADTAIVVGDSKEGWASAYALLITALFAGEIPETDYSLVRAAGVKLKTFGGRASGPEPLKRLFEYTVATFRRAKGRNLTSIEVHDIMCMIGEIVVVGGVRRSALISLSNLSDQRMRDAKSGQWWQANPQRGLANNSVAYTEKPNVEIFMEEWLSLVKSKSGERGIFNRVAAQKQAAKFGRRSAELSYGTNPCCISGDALVDVMIAGEQQKLRFKDAVTLVVAGKDLMIKSYDSVGVVWQPITSAALMRKNAEVIKVTDDKTGKSVTCTPDHLIFTSNRGWVAAAQLHSDDELVVE